jgi:hypothetical protein
MLLATAAMVATAFDHIQLLSHNRNESFDLVLLREVRP